MRKSGAASSTVSLSRLWSTVKMHCRKHTQTFEWIFEQPRGGESGVPTWSSFAEWLEGDSKELYRDKGEPGAGKSTLVKFILRNPKLQYSFLLWADDNPLLVLHSFLWIPGSDLQFSHV